MGGFAGVQTDDQAFQTDPLGLGDGFMEREKKGPFRQFRLQKGEAVEAKIFQGHGIHQIEALLVFG